MRPWPLNGHCIFWLVTAGATSSAWLGREGLKACYTCGVCLGSTTQCRAGILHWLFLLLLCKGLTGAQELCWFLVGKLWQWAGGVCVGPPLHCGGEVQPELASVAGGHGRDQEYQAKAIDISCPMSHIGMSPCVWETQDMSYTSESSRTFFQDRGVVTVPWGPARLKDEEGSFSCCGISQIPSHVF